MSKDYSMALQELTQIRRQMAEIPFGTPKEESVLAIASAVASLAFHVQQLMEQQS